MLLEEEENDEREIAPGGEEREFLADFRLTGYYTNLDRRQLHVVFLHFIYLFFFLSASSRSYCAGQ
jgi:hypothetical protein